MSLLSACPLSVLSVSQSNSILVHLSCQHVVMCFLPNQSGAVFLRVLLKCRRRYTLRCFHSLFQYFLWRHLTSLWPSSVWSVCFRLLSYYTVCIVCMCVCICKQERAPVKSTGLPAQSSPLPPSSHPQCPQTAHTKHTH